MTDKGFRVTVEDLEMGVRQVMVFYSGDYVLIPFAPCYLETTQTYPLKGTHVVTIKDHRPTRPAAPGPSSPDGGDLA